MQLSSFRPSLNESLDFISGSIRFTIVKHYYEMSMVHYTETLWGIGGKKIETNVDSSSIVIFQSK